MCPAGVLGREPTAQLQKGKEIPRIPRASGTKNHLGMRHVGNASPVAGPEKFASDVSGSSVHLVELGRRVPASHRWDEEDSGRQRIEVRGHQEVEELEVWASWLWLLQRRLLWPCLLSRDYRDL